MVVHNLTNSSPQCYTTDFTPSLIGTSVPTRQNSEKNIPNNRPLKDVQTLPEKQKVGDGHVGSGYSFTEGFDSLHHDPNWRSLRNHSISEQYYVDQRATVLTHVESDEFGIARGKNKATL